MGGFSLPFSGKLDTEDTVFEIQCDGGGQAIEGTSTGLDEQGDPGNGLSGWSDGGTGVVGVAIGLNRDGAAVGVAGIGPVGVQGVAQNAPGIARGGQVGRDDSFGVAAINEQGTALFAQGSPFAASFIGDVSQFPGNGGCIKALLYVSTAKAGSERVLKRFFQSIPGIQAPTVYRLDTGIYSIDFHFEVMNRYVSVAAVGANFSNVAGTEPNPYAPLWYPPPAGSVWGTQYVLANFVFDGLTEPPSVRNGTPGERKPSPTMITVMTYKPSLLSLGGGSFVFQGFTLGDADFSVAVF
jgi:hypothetical protein